jgi:hypothetical protein
MSGGGFLRPRQQGNVERARLDGGCVLRDAIAQRADRAPRRQAHAGAVEEECAQGLAPGQASLLRRANQVGNTEQETAHRHRHVGDVGRERCRVKAEAEGLRQVGGGGYGVVGRRVRIGDERKIGNTLDGHRLLQLKLIRAPAAPKRFSDAQLSIETSSCRDDLSQTGK